jgi:magnesium transporter
MARSSKETNTAFARLSSAYLDRHPDEAARDLENTDPVAIAALLAQEPISRAHEVVRLLTPATATDVLANMEPTPAGRLLMALEANRAAALLAGMEPQAQEERLSQLDGTRANELRELMRYPLDSAGHMMDPRVTTFRGDATRRDVVRRLRTIRTRRVQDVFIVDADDHLTGSVAIQDVLLAPPEARLDSLVRTHPPSVTAFAPRDEVLEVLEQFRGRSLPVVDFDGRVLGVLRQEEIIAAAEQAATADLVSMVGAGKDERALSPPLFAVRKRLPWLEINLLTAFLAAAVVGIFESTIARFTALAVLLPVVAGQSGNTGAQALAVTMRGLALREIRLGHWLRVTSKEVFVGGLNGVAVALTTAGAVYVWSRSLGLALVIGVSMILSMTAAGFAGATIPLMLTRLRQDPAQSSSIILTTVTDVVGFFSFLGIATLLSSTI